MLRLHNLLLCALVASIGGCSKSVPSHSWRIAFTDAADLASAAHVRTFVATDCTGSARVYEATFAIDARPSMPPDPLDRGRWAFGAEAIDGSCDVIAEGCQMVELPVASGIITTSLEPIPHTTCEGDCPCTPPRPTTTCDAGASGDAGVCEPGFADCVGDILCETRVAISWNVEIGPELHEGCGAIPCDSIYRLTPTTCTCPTGCWRCQRRPDGSLVAAVADTCDVWTDATGDQVVPVSMTGCSTVRGSSATVQCCQL